MLKFQKFCWPPGQPHLPARFSLAVGQKSKFRLFYLPCCPDSEKVRHNPPAPKPREEIDLAETRFFGVRVARPKIICDYVGSENFAPIRQTVQKLRHFFEVTHGRTDARRDRQKWITLVPLQKFFFHICEGKGGKLYKPYKISTSSLHEG